MQMTTLRLELRRPELSDAAAIDDLDADPEVRRYVDAPPPSPGHGERLIEAWLLEAQQQPELGFWLAHDAGSGDFVGWFHLRADNGKHGPRQAGDLDLGYRLHRRWWGRGLAREGGAALLDYGLRDLSAPRVAASALADNRASIAVMRSLGMTHDCDWAYVDRAGRPQPAVVYAVAAVV